MSIPQGYECGGSSTGCPAGYYIDDTPPSDIPNIYKNKVCQDCGKGYSCAGGTDRQAWNEGQVGEGGLPGGGGGAMAKWNQLALPMLKYAHLTIEVMET